MTAKISWNCERLKKAKPPLEIWETTRSIVYKVLIEKRAEKDLGALDRSLRERIVERLLLLRNNPRPTGSKKLVGSATAYRYGSAILE